MGLARVNPALGDALSTLRERINRFELDWRRTRMPPPTRAQPLPDPEAARIARTLEECGRRLDRIGGQLRSRPNNASENDALQTHLDFLVALTEQESGLAAADDLLISIRHLEALTATLQE